jgi:hypothetical protein
VDHGAYEYISLCQKLIAVYPCANGGLWYAPSLSIFHYCLSVYWIWKNQIKSKIFKDLFGFENFFNSVIWFWFVVIFVKNQIKPNRNPKKNKSCNVLFVSIPLGNFSQVQPTFRIDSAKWS